MKEKTHRKTLAILSALKASREPLSGAEIVKVLQAEGHDISERTVRLYLLQMDREGFTEALGRRGRRITDAGLHELGSSRIIERVGFLSAKIDAMTYRMDFDLSTRSGTVVINVTVADPRHVLPCAGAICRVFEKGFAMGHLMTILAPGERCGDLVVPEGLIGIGTVCSITLNGVLLKHGIPVHSRFGGLIELKNGRATRFVEVITYDGTTIDPLEVFIRSGMTNYLGAVNDGNGRIGASFREIPAESRDRVVELAAKLGAVGLGGFMEIGRGGQALFDIPVSEGRAGAVVIGGLNPVSILEETGVRVTSRALSGLMDYGRLFRYEEFPSRLQNYHPSKK